MTESVQLIYAHDPMCSWCWGFRPAFQQVLANLPKQVGLQRMLGGLAPDSDQLMPIEMQHKLQQTWRRIQEKIPGTEFNFDFWNKCSPRRSTYPSCRAVLAARSFDLAKDVEMTLAIQQAYYLRAMNPSDNTTLVQLAGEIGLPEREFADLLQSDQIEQQLQAEIQQTRRLGADSFPSLILHLADGGYWPISIHYTEPKVIVRQIEELV